MVDVNALHFGSHLLQTNRGMFPHQADCMLDILNPIWIRDCPNRIVRAIAVVLISNRLKHTTIQELVDCLGYGLVAHPSPPVEAGCFKTGDVETDEGKMLKVFRCPV